VSRPADGVVRLECVLGIESLRNLVTVAPGRVAQAFNLAGITNTGGARPFAPSAKGGNRRCLQQRGPLTPRGRETKSLSSLHSLAPVPVRPRDTNDSCSTAARRANPPNTASRGCGKYTSASLSASWSQTGEGLAHICIWAGGPSLAMFVCAIPTEGAPSLRSLQGWDAMLRVHVCMFVCHNTRLALAPTAAQRKRPPRRHLRLPPSAKARRTGHPPLGGCA